MSAAAGKSEYRDSEGNLINYSSDSPKNVMIEVRLTRMEDGIARIDSKMEGMRTDVQSLSADVRKVTKNIETLAYYQRQLTDEQTQLKADIHGDKGVEPRLRCAEVGLGNIFGGLKTAAWIIGMLIAFSGAAFAAIKLMGG